jgi:hypothetical protein
MTGAINNIAGSTSGAQQASQNRAAERKRRDVDAKSAREAFDEYVPTSETQGAESSRTLKDNSQEETREDRVSHNVDRGDQKHPGGKLDVEG